MRLAYLATPALGLGLLLAGPSPAAAEDSLPFPPALLIDLESPDGSTRISAIQAIKPFPELASFDSLLRIAGKDPLPEARAQAIGALWNRGDRRAAHPLEIILNLDSDFSVRLAAAGALGRVGLKTSVPYLASAIGVAAEPTMVARCLRSVGELGDSASTPTVVPFLAASNPTVVRGTAAVALGMLGSEKGAQPLMQSLENDPDPSVRAVAAEALGRLRAPGTEETLVRALLFDKAPTVRYHSAEALASYGHGEEVHTALMKGVRDEDRRVRLKSLVGMTTRWRKEDISTIADLLADPSKVIRDMAHYILVAAAVPMEKVGDRYRLTD